MYQKSAPRVCFILVMAITMLSGCLKISSSNPSDGQVDVARDAPVKAMFNLALDASTVNRNTVVLEEKSGLKKISCELITKGKELTLKPLNRLAVNREYTLRFLPGIKSTIGLGLKNESTLTFKTKAGQWGKPEQVSRILSGISNPMVVSNDNEKAIIVWLQERPEAYGNYKLCIDEYSNGDWSGAIDVYSINDCDNPRAAISDNGDAIILWTVFSYDPFWGRKYSLYKKHFRAGVWDEAELIDESSQYMSTHDVKMDKDSNAVIVWDNGAGKAFKMEYKGNYWSSTEQIGSNDASCSVSSFEMNASGDAVIIWNEQRNDSFDRFISVLINSKWSIPEKLTETGNRSILIEPEGRIVFVWMEYSEGGLTTYVYSRFFEKDVWSEKKLIYQGCHFSDIVTAKNRMGEELLVWRDDKTILQMNYKNHMWDPSIKNIFESQSIYNIPQAASLDNSGNIVIVWEERGTLILKERFNDKWLDNKIINNSIESEAWKPSVSSDNNGNKIIIWLEDDNSGTRLFRMESR
jgi:uncharacterized protein YheU (UPF0270 family)